MIVEDGFNHRYKYKQLTRIYVKHAREKQIPCWIKDPVLLRGKINIGPHSSGKNQPPDLSLNTQTAHRIFLKCWFWWATDNLGNTKHTRSIAVAYALLQLFSRYSHERLKEWYSWALRAVSDG